MANKDYKVFIVEGAVREPQIIENISNLFFDRNNIKIITLPAGENIYMLWKKLKADEFETDIIEVLRDIIDVYAMKISCLFGTAVTLEYRQYSELVNPYEIYALEKAETARKGVYVLSAFPEFLVDYRGEKLWRTCVKHKKNQRKNFGC